MSKQWNSCYY